MSMCCEAVNEHVHLCLPGNQEGVQVWLSLRLAGLRLQQSSGQDTGKIKIIRMFCLSDFCEREREREREKKKWVIHCNDQCLLSVINLNAGILLRTIYNINVKLVLS